MQKKTLPHLRQAVVESMQALKHNSYFVPAERNLFEKINYLSYFFTNQTKPRMVYDDSETYSDCCVNDSSHTDPDLLNKLSSKIARYRLRKYALTAYLSQCFFQIIFSESQQDCFRIL